MEVISIKKILSVIALSMLPYMFTGCIITAKNEVNVHFQNKKQDKNSTIKGISLETALDNLGMNNMWDKGLSGKGVTVAVIDTGASVHTDYKDNLLYFLDLVNNKEVPYDDNGHGTQVCGIIAGNGFMSQGRYKGIAPDSKIVMIKALNNDGTFRLYNVQKSIEWVINNKEKYNIKILCMPLGYKANSNYKEDLLYESILKAKKKGILIIASSGNNGLIDNSVTSPGLFPEVLTVGAVKVKINEDTKSVNYEKADFSSEQVFNDYKKPDVLAPGNNITTTQFGIFNKDSIGENKYYTTVAGTSFSAAVVAGEAALLVEMHPKWTTSHIEEFIKENVKDKVIYIRDSEKYMK